MTEARIVYFEKEGRDLVSINAVDPIRASFPLSKDLDRALLLSALAESLETFVSESDPAEPFYRLARHAMDALFAGAPGGSGGGLLRRLDPEALGPLSVARASAPAAAVRSMRRAGAPLRRERGRASSGAECRRGESPVRVCPCDPRATLGRFLSGPRLGSGRRDPPPA